ncbi:MAG: hypothetical protein C0508_23270, partial [Cyanobacteria bacterium PR.023]|nr:hypothetical protein [Cyanobacteria bacterium PR.023]
MSNPLSGAPLGPISVDGKTIDARAAAFLAANACESKLAQSVVVLDVASVTVLAEYFVFAGGESAAQVKAIANAVDQALGSHDF